MRTRPVAAAAVALLALTGCAGATRYQPKGRLVPYQGRFVKFSSGLGLVVYEMPESARFAVTVSYRAGGMDDPAGKEGLAHLAEHLAFRGGRPRLWNRLQASGMGFNAFTSHEHTTFWVSGKAADFETALAIEAQRMVSPLAGVVADDLAVERDVVLSETRERSGLDPDSTELSWLLEATFPGHSYARPIPGTAESLARVQLADVQAFTAERYIPSNAVVVVVSPRPAEETARMVARAFGELAQSTTLASPVPYTPPPFPAPRERIPLAVRKAPVSAPHLWIGWPVPGLYAEQLPRELALESTVAGYLEGYLGPSEAWDHVDEVDVGLTVKDGAGLLFVRLSLRDEADVDHVLDRVKRALWTMRKWAELNAGSVGLRNHLHVASLLEMEELTSPFLAQWVRRTGRPDYIGDWQRLVALELSKPQAEADFQREYVTAERMVPLLVLPDRNPALRASTGAVVQRRDDSVEELLDDESVAPPAPERVAQVATPPGLDRSERRVLPSGLTVVLLRRGGLPIADVRLVVRTDPEGTSAIPAGLPALAIGSGWVRGAYGSVSSIGADGRLVAERGKVVYGMTGSSGNLDVMLESIGEWIDNLAAGGRFDTVRKFAVRAVDRARRLPGGQAEGLMRARLFPGHPDGEVASPEGLGGVSGSLAARFIEEQLRPERAQLIVVSDQPASPELFATVERHLGGWTKRGRPPLEAVAPAPLPERRQVLLVDRRGADQALLSMGIRVPLAAEGDAAGLEAVRHLLRTRLEQRLRVEEGVSYGVRASRLDLPGGGALLLDAAVERDAAARSLSTMLESIRALAAAPVAPAAAARARWQVARAYGFRFDSVARAATGLEELAARGWAADAFERIPASIQALDAGRIHAAARSAAQGREVVVVVGDQGALLPQLRAAGFEVEVVKPPPPGARAD